MNAGELDAGLDLECADLDEAVQVAGKFLAAWDGAVEVRPVIKF